MRLPAATTPASRARFAGAVLWLSCASLVGCAATSMTARSARLPVLVGPVACIGCAAASSAGAQSVAPISDGVYSRGGYLSVPHFGDVGFFGANTPEIDLKAESVAPDACKADVRISRLTARSFGVVAVIYVNAEQTVDLVGDVVSVPLGTCGPRPWPYSGPQGIVTFDGPAALRAGNPTSAAAGGSP